VFLVSTAFKIGAEFGLAASQGIEQAESENEMAYARLAAGGIRDMFGVDVPESAFRHRAGRLDRERLNFAIGNSALAGMFGAEGVTRGVGLAPDDAPAKKFAGFMMQFATEGWLSGWIAELSSFGALETFGELDDIVSESMGLGRLSRMAFRPYVDINIATPLEWKLNKLYRPRLLGASDAVRQFQRGRWTRAQLLEELARQGYSDDRIEGLINGSTKFVDVSRLSFLVRAQFWTATQAVNHLVEQGYTREVATTLMAIEAEEPHDRLRQRIAEAAMQAFIRRDIDAAALRRLLDIAQLDPELRRSMMAASETLRALNTKDLSEGDAEQAVKRGIWTLVQFRSHLWKLGYADEDIRTRELLLLDEIGDAASAEKKRKELEAERAADRARRQAEALERRAEVERRRELAGVSRSDVERAYVRGLISIEDYRRRLAREGVSVADQELLLELIGAERADYIAAQAKRAEAEASARQRRLSLSAIEEAVRRGILTLDDYRSSVESFGFGARDQEILVRLLESGIEDELEERRRKAQVAEELKRKQVSLADVERAVVLGIKTIADYRAFLVASGYSVVDAALLTNVLTRDVLLRREAERKRTEAEAEARVKRIGLAELRQAVRRGIRTIDDYRAVLRDAGIVPEDQGTLVALLEAEIADDRAAAAKRAETEARLAKRKLTLGDMERAVRLGVLTLDQYRAYLRREKVVSDDQEVLISILREELRQAAEAKALRSQREADARARGPALAEIRQAVLRGLAPAQQYADAVRDARFSPEDQRILMLLLFDEIKQSEAARLRRAALDAARSTRELSRADMERAVKEGIKGFREYIDFLAASGYSEEDQAILQELLVIEMEKPPRPAGRAPTA
jgi:hypothetical protein